MYYKHFSKFFWKYFSKSSADVDHTFFRLVMELMTHLLWLLPMWALLCKLKDKKMLHLMQHQSYFSETDFHR